MPFTVLGGIIVNIALCDHIHMWIVQFGLNILKFIWHLRTLIMLISKTIPWQLHQFIWRHLNMFVLIRVVLLTIINTYKKGQRPICYSLFLVLMSAWKRKQVGWIALFYAVTQDPGCSVCRLHHIFFSVTLEVTSIWARWMRSIWISCRY